MIHSIFEKRMLQYICIEDHSPVFQIAELKEVKRKMGCER
jgi:hypothetical protein